MEIWESNFLNKATVIHALDRKIYCSRGNVLLTATNLGTLMGEDFGLLCDERRSLKSLYTPNIAGILPNER